MVTSTMPGYTTRTLAATICVVGLLTGCAVLRGTPRVGATYDGYGELMTLDAPVGQTSVRCPAHRANGGAHVGYSSYAFTGSPAQIRAEVCPLVPLPSDNRWVYTQRTRPDAPDAVELWASITSEGFRPQWQRAAPTLSFVCALEPDTHSINVRLDWVMPPHLFEGTFDGAYSLTWQTSPMWHNTRWEASPIEAEAVWMLEPSPETLLETLLHAPQSGSAQDAIITFDVIDDTGTQFRAVFDLNGWEHALSPLTTDCSGTAT